MTLCYFCGNELNERQLKIEKKLCESHPECSCREVLLIDRLKQRIKDYKKEIKNLKELHSDHVSFLMEHDDMLWAFEEWQKENSQSNDAKNTVKENKQ